MLISKDGYGKSVEGAPTVAIYMDFLCPGCGNLHRQLDEDLQKMVDAGQINLDLHFMAFMDKWSTDDYSSRAANAAIYLAEHDSDPSHLITFLEKMYAEDFQPEESSNYKSVSADQVKELEQIVCDTDHPYTVPSTGKPNEDIPENEVGVSDASKEAKQDAAQREELAIDRPEETDNENQWEDPYLEDK